MNQPTEAAPPPISTATLILQHPIQREGGSITELTLRKPKGGELRGLNIQSLMVGDVSSIIALLPRISVPIITAHEAAQLEAEDFAEAAGIIHLFFVSSAQKMVIREMMGGSASKE